MGALGGGANHSRSFAGQAAWVFPELSDSSRIHTCCLSINSVVLRIPGNTMQDVMGEAPQSDACDGTSQASWDQGDGT